MSFLRQPIISILGHVDHGKTSLLDFIRKSNLTNKEAGGITQHIGASEIPRVELEKIVKNFLPKDKIKISGLLFIDTPGHEAFTTLRKRGGNICDIGVLIVDINEGLKPQTIESIEILKSTKTPFVIAANKIDKIPMWKIDNSKPLIKNIESQREDIMYKFEEKIYELVSKINEFGYDCDRFDRVDDFTKKICIVPISAKSGEGICELISTIVGLTQKYMENKLTIEKTSRGFGTILEIKNKIGVGQTFDIILYDGKIQKKDLVLTIDKNLNFKKSHIKSILKPTKSIDIRDKSAKFVEFSEVYCACGVKIVCKDLENINPGSPIITLREDESEEQIEKYKRKIIEDNITPDISFSKEGVLIKADTIGSLEAIAFILKENSIDVRKAKIGKITKNDILDVNASKEKNEKYSIILNFNQTIDDEILKLSKENKITILSNEIIYKLIEDTKNLFENFEKVKKEKMLESLNMPFCIKVLENCIFKNSKPAVVGVEVLKGVLKVNSNLINEVGEKIGKVMQIKDKTENLKDSEEKSQVAISIDKGVVLKNVFTNKIYYSEITENDFEVLKENKHILSENQKECLKEIVKIKREKNSFWGK